MVSVTPIDAPCGALVQDLDLTKPLSAEQITLIRSAWLSHHVLVFPDQPLSDDDLERFALYFGTFGHDPFFQPIDGRAHIAAIARKADETTPLFAENWHTDWSFQGNPPIGTCLFGITIPPVGGDTLFANQHKAYEDMPDALKEQVDPLIAIHSAATAYGPEGMYSDRHPQEAGRSMRIITSDAAHETQTHPFVRPHTETGRAALYSTLGYIQGFVGMDKAESDALLIELYHYQTQDQFVYAHKWQENMLVMWDNRSVLHRATGGYDGYDRLLHRITISQF